MSCRYEHNLILYCLSPSQYVEFSVNVSVPVWESLHLTFILIYFSSIFSLQVVKTGGTPKVPDCFQRTPKKLCIPEKAEILAVNVDSKGKSSPVFLYVSVSLIYVISLLVWLLVVFSRFVFLILNWLSIFQESMQCWKLVTGYGTVSLTWPQAKLNRRTTSPLVIWPSWGRVSAMWPSLLQDRWDALPNQWFVFAVLHLPYCILIFNVEINFLKRNLPSSFEMEMAQSTLWPKTAWVAFEILIGWTCHL